MFFSFDLFIHNSQPSTFDGPTHISNIAQVYGALKDGEIPAQWGQGFARYGMPIPIIAQQVTSYLGAVINFITQNVLLSYNIVVLLGTFFSTLLMYIFLRFYVKPLPALAGAILFCFAPYRIMNVYIRGALPEFFVSTFIISTLISMYIALEKEKIYGYFLLAISLALLLLTHPFMIIVSSIIFIPYGLFLLYKKKHIVSSVILLCFAGAFGLALTAYYLIPLFLEIKYFYYGSSSSHFVPGHFLTLRQFIVEEWFYFRNDVGTRAHWHLGGVVEGITLLVGIIYAVWLYLKKKKLDIVSIFSSSGILYIFFMLPISEKLYTSITLLGNIQHPWRMLTGYIIVPPILFAILFSKVKRQYLLFAGLMVVLALIRFPQLYGKNYTNYSQQSYFVTDYNLHGQVMNTVWMGKERDYPYKKEKAEIVAGNGNITSRDVRNAKRTYTVDASEEVRLVDYTFYYPGWKVFVDDVEVPIEFQDPNYRGVITYKVPAGTHQVSVIFTNTKVRLLGIITTCVSSLIFILLLVLLKSSNPFITKLIKKYSSHAKATAK